MEIRFALIPKSAISRKMGRLGKKYGSKFPRRFLVDNRKYFPHVTLFKVDLPKKNYKQLLAVVKKFLNHAKPFTVIIDDYQLSPGGWLDLNIVPSKKLLFLRQELFQKVYDSGLVDAHMKPKYRPHITLTRFYSDKKAIASIEGSPKPTFKMKVGVVGLCLSRQTQVYKIVNSVKLS